jgi:hypothetical protein
MGIRRRKRKLSTLMSRLDQRVRSVELRPINLLTSEQVESAVTIGAPSTGPETIVSSSAPYQFRKIQDAYVYPKAITKLTTDRVEIYLESDIGAAAGDRIEVSGIHWASNAPIDVTGDNFIVEAVDTPPWDGRPSYRHNPEEDQLSTVTINNTYYFKPETTAPASWTNRRRLQTKRRIDTFSIVGTTVTLVMNAVHHFEVGDVIFVDVFADDSRAYGTDGLFRITAVTSTTITYELFAGVASPTGVITPVEFRFVYPVAREWAQVGSIWVDSSQDKTYYWDGIRWVDYTPSTVIGKDGDPPAPPTGLTVTSEGSVSTTVSFPTAKVTLSWTAPTLTAAGEELTDLAGYKIKWRKSLSEDPRDKTLFEPNITSYTFDDDVRLEQGTTYYFELYAFDSGQQDSTAATATHTTAIKTSPLSSSKPTPPRLESRLGTLTATWDGLLATVPPTSPPADVLYLKIHRSVVDNFTPSDSSLVATISAVANNYASFAELTYGTDYYFRFVLIDTSGVQSLPSDQVVGRVTPLVDTDLLVANVLNSWTFAGQQITAGALADGSLNASTLFGPNVIVQNAIAANAIGANQIAAGSIIAGKIGANAITANVMAANSISAGAIQANAIEADKINVGALDGKLITGSTVRTSGNNPRVEMNSTGLYAFNSGGGVTFRVLSSDGSVFIASGVQIGGYATTADLSGYATTGALDGKINNGAAAADINANTTTISGGKITTGTVDAQRLVSDLVLSTMIRTATSGPRIEIRGSSIANPGIVSFTSSGTAFRFYSNGLSYLDDVIIESGGKITAGSTIIQSGSITGGTIRTATTGQRVEMRGGSNQDIRFVDSGGTQRGTIAAASTGVSITGVGTEVLLGSNTVNIRTGGISRITAIETGVIIGTAPTTAAAANLRRPSGSEELAVFSSDLRIKENVVPVHEGLSVINSLNPVTFNSKVDKTDKIFSGFLAQDVQNIFPSTNFTVVTEEPGVVPDTGDADPEDFAKNPLLSINHVELIAYLTKAIQELDQKNKELEYRIQGLESSDI